MQGLDTTSNVHMCVYVVAVVVVVVCVYGGGGDLGGGCATATHERV